MPGMSLWLIPRDDNPFTKTAQELISDTVPRNFVSAEETNHFPPHVTVTSDIDADAVHRSNPQEWLDALSLPAFRAEHDEVLLELDTVEAEDPFFRKMNVALKENGNLRKLAAACRAQAVSSPDGDDASAAAATAEKWSREEYRPHMSLLYADVATADVRNKIPLIEMKIGFALGDLFACCGGTLSLGGSLVLVDTTRPVKEWVDAVLAKRETPWAMWRATRNLI